PINLILHPFFVQFKNSFHCSYLSSEREVSKLFFIGSQISPAGEKGNALPLGYASRCQTAG
ncbi:MAG: hypothetical protein WCE69_14770, partial [Aestuariivirga sp.]